MLQTQSFVQFTVRVAKSKATFTVSFCIDTVSDMRNSPDVYQAEEMNWAVLCDATIKGNESL